MTPREQQIAHIREHQVLFNEFNGYERDVEEFFDEYYDKYNRENGPGGLYLAICSDLEITPRDIYQ